MAAAQAGAHASGRAAELAAAAQAFARDFLSPSAVAAYVVALLRGYAALQLFTPTLHVHARPAAADLARLDAMLEARREARRRCTNDPKCCRRHPKACESLAASRRRRNKRRSA